MADIISFADWQALQALIKEGNAAVSGMTAAEAQAALGASANSGLYTYQAITAAGANNVINFPNATTAAEAADEYVAAGGATSSAGAATAATGAAETAANLTVIEGGAAGTSGVAGLLAMPLPTAAAALAPLAGAALGVGLYEINPEFWTKLSQTLLPFCYDDSELMKVTVDNNGNTYYPESAIEAVKNLMKQYETTSSVPSDNPLNVPSFNFSILTDGYLWIRNTEPGSSYHFTQKLSGWEKGGIFTYSGHPAYIVASATNTNKYWGFGISDNPSSMNTPHTEIASKYTYNNKTVYYYYTLVKSIKDTYFDTNALINFNIDADIEKNAGKYAWLMIYGNYSADFPEGITPWYGNTYPDGVTPLKVLTGYDEEGNPIYTPYYPVATPIGDPGVSTNPSVNPDPSVNPNPKPAIEPYISPVPDPSKYPENVPVPPPAPLPNPVPSPQPVPDPSTDPSQDPDDGGVPDDPTPPKDPTDTGDTPTPTIPIIPILPSSATGLLHVYNPTQTQIDQFGSWLWTTFSGDLIDTLSKLFNDPMDAVIGLHELYSTPATSGDTTIKAGYLDSGVSSKLVGSRYTTINCGSVVVEEYYQNYLDYSPYTQCYIYLPFIGIVTVSADDIIGNAVNIVYHIDSYTGCCIAVVTVAKKGYSSTVYQFEGNCAVEIPITSGYQSTMIAGLMGVAGTAISGNPTVGLHAAHIGRAGLGKNSVQHSGSFGASFGAMGVKIPYIIVKRPTQKVVTNYSISYGYPAHKMVYVGNCTGYLRAKEVRVTSTTATNIEKEMIVSALKAGVYVK